MFRGGGQGDRVGEQGGGGSRETGLAGWGRGGRDRGESIGGRIGGQSKRLLFKELLLSAAS